jgi:DNA-binding winged helix-turn-helix (wHTH) protein
MSNPTPPTDVLRFGRFELRVREHQLLADGEPVALGGRAFDLLLVLTQRAGQLVTRNELIELVWPGRFVEENNLSVQINALRKVLGGEWLVTVPGRGYRFVAPPRTPAADAEPEPAALPRTNLPTLQPLLIGRSDDLAALGTLIDQHRLVTVVGAGAWARRGSRRPCCRCVPTPIRMVCAGSNSGRCPNRRHCPQRWRRRWDCSRRAATHWPVWPVPSAACRCCWHWTTLSTCWTRSLSWHRRCWMPRRGYVWSPPARRRCAWRMNGCCVWARWRYRKARCPRRRRRPSVQSRCSANARRRPIIDSSCVTPTYPR